MRKFFVYLEILIKKFIPRYEYIYLQPFVPTIFSDEKKGGKSRTTTLVLYSPSPHHRPSITTT